MVWRIVPSNDGGHHGSPRPWPNSTLSVGIDPQCGAEVRFTLKCKRVVMRPVHPWLKRLCLKWGWTKLANLFKSSTTPDFDLDEITSTGEILEVWGENPEFLSIIMTEDEAREFLQDGFPMYERLLPLDRRFIIKDLRKHLVFHHMH